MAVGLSFVIANGDIDLSVGVGAGAVGVDRGVPDEDSWAATRCSPASPASSAGLLAGCVNGAR